MNSDIKLASDIVRKFFWCGVMLLIIIADYRMDQLFDMGVLR